MRRGWLHGFLGHAVRLMGKLHVLLVICTIGKSVLRWILLALLVAAGSEVSKRSLSVPRRRSVLLTCVLRHVAGGCLFGMIYRVVDVKNFVRVGFECGDVNTLELGCDGTGDKKGRTICSEYSMGATFISRVRRAVQLSFNIG